MKRGRIPKPELSPQMAGLSRLSKDGACSTATVRRRVALIAAERKLDDSETKVLMKGRWLTVRHIGEFAEKHHVSVDWLLGGDLKGRLRMAHNEIAMPSEPAARPSSAMREVFRALVSMMTEDDKQWLLAKMRETVGRPA
jgi:hypothetical protein